jgi:hypothetical protein
MAMPEMVPVDSTNIVRVGYDDGSQELYIEFDSGRTYIYSDVASTTYEELMAADSKGSYLNREIKPNYACREM